MKTVIEFDLPDDEDAHLDAVQGAKWRALVGRLKVFLLTREATEKYEEKGEAFREVSRFLAEETRTVGLTCLTASDLRREHAEFEKSCEAKLDALPPDE
jgi:hypothetical protein